MTCLVAKKNCRGTYPGRMCFPDQFNTLGSPDTLLVASGCSSPHGEFDEWNVGWVVQLP